MSITKAYFPKLTLGCCFGLLMLMVPFAQAQDLDGQTFEVKMQPKGTDKLVDNRLTFKSGTFLSAVCVQHGFAQSDYVSYEKDGVVHFTVDAESPEKGDMKWKGQIVDGQLVADAVWQKPGKEKPVEFVIKGASKK
ncbi:hypothetical protein [Kangiella shandongensis]|uniref:hypothetical protein n=1 Tax=Kangiella shandongensis TaxID=2763258 RepID=UPI001CBBCA95|nr:hypothetical protein [Kangiella shandongensis]